MELAARNWYEPLQLPRQPPHTSSHRQKLLAPLLAHGVAVLWASDNAAIVIKYLTVSQV